MSALGVLSRLMPQMQVFFVGVPLSILIGFLILLLVVGAMMGTLPRLSSAACCASSRPIREQERPMADEQDDTEKSEDPTQKRLDEALERGDVVKSQEVNTWFVIAAATLILMSFSGSMSSGLTTHAARPARQCARHPGRRARPRAASMQKLGIEVDRGGRDPVPAAGARGDRRQHDPAPAGLVGREPQAEALQDLAGGRLQAAVLQDRAGRISSRA